MQNVNLVDLGDDYAYLGAPDFQDVFDGIVNDRVEDLEERICEAELEDSWEASILIPA